MRVYTCERICLYTTHYTTTPVFIGYTGDIFILHIYYAHPDNLVKKGIMNGIVLI